MFYTGQKERPRQKGLGLFLSRPAKLASVIMLCEVVQELGIQAWLRETQCEKAQREKAQCEKAQREKAQREKAQHLEALLEEVELEVLPLETLRLNSLSLKKVQLVAFRLKEVQLELLKQLAQLKQAMEQGEWWKFRLELILESQPKTLLHKVLRRTELILTELWQHRKLIHRFLGFLAMIWQLGFLAMLWQKLLESLLFSHNASEFPNKRRPPCTTMPWNIRPALVVLWGVCWMFNPWSPIDDIQLQPLSADELTLFSSGKVFPHSNVHFVQLTSSTQILTMS